ncbi:STAS-like domain-containing protein [Deinococcus gobiensis]|uniref:DUF4325 domain-containing protein n=1 Tax=Deinococcus gobiensis (strain DSM 21396 / JCM 16679 / CGMCC 1.7299 / I-0) TaxID=745776 RepID=H8H3V4_DEIGI|nr:STAS-like domain-containing protein [Deinococcus gobiensis]AFD28201.1 hypothetical protein DGo_PE0057 [Deinococcus gobiensis I-0]
MSKETFEMSIVGIINNPICTSVADGEKVYDRICPIIEDGNIVKLSFAGVRYIISAFLNPAFGKLYLRFDQDYIREHLKAVNTTPEQRSIIKEVVENAKFYAASKEEAKEARIDASGFKDEE